MKLFNARYLLLAAFSLLLGACQSTPPAAPQAPDARAAAIAQLEQNLASSELATAEDELAALQAQSPNDPALEPYQRQLAEAYLQRSQIVLQKGDVNAAATALSRARALMPKAPALTGGVNSAIAHARKVELDKAEAALKAYLGTTLNVSVAISSDTNASLTTPRIELKATKCRKKVG